GGMIARRLDEAMAKHNAKTQQEDVECDESEDQEYSRDMNPILQDSMCVPPPPLVDLDSEDIEKPPPKKKQPRKKVAREYVPAYRSGPYALILTLYQQSQRLNYRGYMTRAELQKEAQPLCDASFTMKIVSASKRHSTSCKQTYKWNNASDFLSGLLRSIGCHKPSNVRGTAHSCINCLNLLSGVIT
ncbi:hypothetical protein ACROYT_G040402, partial [Oculina patagonica]